MWIVIALRLVGLLVRLAVIAAMLWAGLSVALFAIMLLPPATFASIVAHVPQTFLTRVLPFRQLWTIARQGRLNAGDAAPLFDLPLHDGSVRIRLSDFQGKQPVVLVFGSYT